MKVYLVFIEFFIGSQKYKRYSECFINELDAYKYAHSLTGGKPIIEVKEFNI